MSRNLLRTHNVASSAVSDNRTDPAPHRALTRRSATLGDFNRLQTQSAGQAGLSRGINFCTLGFGDVKRRQACCFAVQKEEGASLPHFRSPEDVGTRAQGI